MSIIELTADEQAALTSGYTRGAAIQFAAECKELASKVQRDLIAVASHCQALLAAGKHPAVAADYARNATYLATDMGRFTPKMDTVKATALAVYGYPAAETDAIHKVMAAGVERLLSTPEDGSTIAADAQAVVEQFLAPPSLWS